MDRFNTIGISRQVDWARRGHFFRADLFGSPLAAIPKTKTT